MSNEPEKIDEREVTLVQLRTELAELMKFRGEVDHAEDCNINRLRTAEPAAARPCNCEVAAIDQRITQYVHANLRKVDNVRQFWRYAEDMLAAAEQDYKDAGARRSSWEAKLDFLKGVCADAMIVMGEKKLEGLHGFIRLQPNGGPVALDLYNSALIPESMVVYQGSIASAAWSEILEACATAGIFPLLNPSVKMERVPMLGTVKAELEAKCDRCGGAGTYDGIPAAISERKPEGCPECAGTGKRIVPGARLGVRGKHVRIR